MSLRIISGERRGARLRTPEGLDTRPLRDRVREALFNIVRPTIAGARVLDAFAGTGAVGLEALSNGAEHATFIEPHPLALHAINDNVRKLRYEERAHVHAGHVPAALERLPRQIAPFSMVFLMPPYNSGLVTEFLDAPALAHRLQPQALIICEVHRDEEFAEAPGFEQVDDRLYGITRLVFLRIAP